MFHNIIRKKQKVVETVEAIGLGKIMDGPSVEVIQSDRKDIFGVPSIKAVFGLSNNSPIRMTSRTLRELAKSFTELADALDDIQSQDNGAR